MEKYPKVESKVFRGGALVGEYVMHKFSHNNLEMLLTNQFEGWTRRSTTCCRRIGPHSTRWSSSPTPRSRWRRTPSSTWSPQWLTTLALFIRCHVSDFDDFDGAIAGWNWWQRWWFDVHVHCRLLNEKFSLALISRCVYLQTHVMELGSPHHWRKSFLAPSMPGCTSTGGLGRFH